MPAPAKRPSESGKGNSRMHPAGNRETPTDPGGTPTSKAAPRESAAARETETPKRKNPPQGEELGNAAKSGAVQSDMTPEGRTDRLGSSVFLLCTPAELTMLLLLLLFSSQAFCVIPPEGHTLVLKSGLSV